MKDLATLSCLQLRDAIASGTVTSVDAVRSVFDAIDAHEESVGSYITIFRQRALEQAEETDKSIAAGHPPGPLAGIPIAIKDNMCTEFGTTSCGSKSLQNYRSPYTATAVQKLIDAGAVIVGKTNMDEFAMGSSTENSALQTTSNPWDTDRVPGGSSGGSATAIASGMCYAAIGSDTGGSIRQPASFCGVTGLKPTYGRISRYGLVAYGSSLDQIGPVTRTVADTALMMNIIAGFDPVDSTSVNEDVYPTRDYLDGLDLPLENLVIGTVPQYTSMASDEVRTATEDAINLYRQMGATTVEIDLPHMEYAISAYYIIAMAEASSNLARYDGVHYGHRSKSSTGCVEMYKQSRQEGFGSEVKRRIMLGTFALSSGYYDAFYLKALKTRNLIRRDLEQAFEKCHCIMMPVAPTTAFRKGEKTADPMTMYLSDIFTVPANLAGIPAISIPCGFDSSNLPIGLQILTPAFSEDKLLRIANMYETGTDWHAARPF